MNVEIISSTHFTINGKTVYKKDNSWFANPYLTTKEETEKARETIKDLQTGKLKISAEAKLPEIS